MRGDRIGTGGILLLRVISLVWSGLLGLLFLSGLPAYYRYIANCAGSECAGASIEMLPAAALESLRLTAAGTAFLYAGFDLFCFLIYAGAAAIIVRKRSREPVPLISCVLLVSYAFITMYPDSLLHASAWETVEPLYRLADSAAFLSVFLFGLLFPDGRAPRRWMAMAGWLVFLPRFLSNLAQDTWPIKNWPQWLTFCWMTAFYGLLLTVQIYRYRCVSDAKQRRQTKLFVLGFTFMILGVCTVLLIPLMWQPDFYEIRNPSATLLQDVPIRLLFLLLPVTLVVSVLRRRLWNIEPVVNRTLLYVSLSGCMAILYVGIVWYLGTVFGTGNHAAASLAATGLIAILFAPLKERIQNGLNRFMYGKKEDPYASLLRLGHRLKEPHQPEDIMQLIVRTVRDTLKLPYVSLKLSRNGGFAEVAEAGASRADHDNDLEELPLIMNGEELGVLTVAPPPPGEWSEDQDRKLLELLARQATVVVAGVKQTLDIRLLAKELQQSRERLVLGREEERLALRRNLHDDLAPRLAALALNAENAEELIKRNPAKAAAIVSGLKTAIRETVGDIRGLVYDLRPPALDELGLVGAVRQKLDELAEMAAIRSVKANGDVEALRIEMTVPGETLPQLPAAVEAAAYRILVEAVLNCVKHANAANCTVRLTHEQDALLLSIADDGIGMEVQSAAEMNAYAVKGVGLASIRERTAELGGRFVLVSSPANGTLVEVRLPCGNIRKGQVFDVDSRDDSRIDRR
ncbi:sensor histidine kinase [Cohnella sp. CFH 77786]|uniref:GAF domain-containing sensor histidine kinase n=1 Tax=Cohnella sp. CFH 77786 TaxID=2662265 RepID=UPI001C60F2EE|nr:ATP-binding protein [Cohnella sp. CFH 77786]MBW5445491.1 sensor histidine kinase [Cohnella sp. CFH 77786]